MRRIAVRPVIAADRSSSRCTCSFIPAGTDHIHHRERASMIRRNIAWRNRHVTDPTLRKVIRQAELIKRVKLPGAAPVQLAT